MKLSDMRVGHPERYAPWLTRLHVRVRRLLARLPAGLAEFLLFGFKQAWASLFGGLLLVLIVLSKMMWQPAWPVHRYDALFVAAVIVQIAFLALRLEEPDEAKVILIFHLVATIMEIFKTSVGSWAYPEPAWISIGRVPLFAGFMYASVGSYIVRVMRIFDMRISHYPPLWWTAALAGAIYLNFFLHHYLPDIRLVLFGAAVVLFGRCRIYFTVDDKPRWMPLLLATLLTAIFIWIGENVGTATRTWSYPGQQPWQPVSAGKLGSWFLLLIVSFVLVTFVRPPRPPEVPAAGPRQRIGERDGDAAARTFAAPEM